MKKAVIKVLLFSILILYACLDRFILIIPFVLLLLFIFLMEVGSLRKRDVNNVYTSRMTFFIIYSVLTFLWSPNVEDAKYEVMVLIMLFTVGFLLFYFIRKYDNFNLILYSLLIISFINHIGALGVPIFDSLMYNTSDRGGTDGVINGWGWKGRYSGITENPNALAVLLLFSLFLSVYVLDNKDNIARLTKPMRYVCFINILLCLYTLFLTQSRKGMIFGVMLLLLYAVLSFSGKRIFPYIVGALLLIIIPTIIPETNEHIEKGLGRVEALFGVSSNERGVDNSALTRYYFITEGWKGFLEKPIFGHGINSFRHYFGLYAHNNFIELLYGVGVVGFFIYYSIHLSILRKLVKKWRENAFLIAFVLIIMAMDVGLVSYENKMSMLTLITLLIILDHTADNITFTRMNKIKRRLQA